MRLASPCAGSSIQEEEEGRGKGAEALQEPLQVSATVQKGFYGTSLGCHFTVSAEDWARAQVRAAEALSANQSSQNFADGVAIRSFGKRKQMILTDV